MSMTTTGLTDAAIALLVMGVWLGLSILLTLAWVASVEYIRWRHRHRRQRLAAEITRRARPGFAPSPPTPAATSFSFLYVDTEVPVGVTLREWRQERAARATLRPRSADVQASPVTPPVRVWGGGR